jgi:pimeloyl-ACP methyl ester carboxylesterase
LNPRKDHGMGTEFEIPHSVLIEGQRIAFSQTGKGYCIALLHGIPTSRLLWRHAVPLLVVRGCEVTAIDFLGYGQSDQPDNADLGIAAQARLIGMLLETIGWRDGALVGHDIGGGIAQLVALECPALLDRLVLDDTIAYDSFPVGPLVEGAGLGRHSRSAGLRSEEGPAEKLRNGNG